MCSPLMCLREFSIFLAKNVNFFIQIDTKGIERILIVKEEAEALDLVSEVGTVPKNLKYALTFNFGQYLPAPNIRTYSVHPSKNTKQVLQLSVDQLIQRLQQVIVLYNLIGPLKFG